MPIARLPMSLLLAFTATAQTYVVDVGNGPGTHFTSLSTAVASVPDGSILLVQAGDYLENVVIDGKALTILASGSRHGPGLTAVSSLRVANTQPGQAVSLRGMLVRSAELANCAGQVLWEDVRAAPRWRCSDCSQVVLRGVTAVSVATIRNTLCIAEDCTFYGEGGCYDPAWACNTPPKPGLDLVQCTFVIRHCSVQGGSWSAPAGWLLSATEGMRLNGADVKLLDSVVASGSGAPFNGSITGAGIVRADPLTTFTANALQLSPPAVVAPMPRLASTGAATGGTITVGVDGVTGDLAILLVGLPGPPLLLPGLVDAFWLDPAMFLFHAFGTAPLSAGLAVPPTPALRGFRLGWQAVTFGSSGAGQVSNPAIDLIR